MKTIRSLTILLGFSLVLFALGVTKAGAQKLERTSFSGTFTLPLDTQWGSMTLPAGVYSLNYGRIFPGGTNAAAVVGKAEGSPRGWILAESHNTASASKNALICARDGNRLVVRRLDLPAIGESVGFALPRGVKLIANQRNSKGSTQIAEVPVLIQRVPLKASGK